MDNNYQKGHQANMVDFNKDKNTKPNDANLSTVLGDSFSAFKELERKLADFEAELEWRFYKDGGWLAKITRKKKTLIWGWAEPGFFGTNFIFQNKPHLREGISELDISEPLKNNFEETPNGAYFSLQIKVYSEADLDDVYKMIEYKRKA
jgi:hypothetical protein